MPARSTTTAVTVSSRMEDRNDLLQLYGSVGTDNFLDSGLPYRAADR